MTISSIGPLVCLFIFSPLSHPTSVRSQVSNDECPAVHHTHTPDDRTVIPIKITSAVVPILTTGMHEDLASTVPDDGCMSM